MIRSSKFKHKNKKFINLIKILLVINWKYFFKVNNSEIFELILLLFFNKSDQLILNIR